MTEVATAIKTETTTVPAPVAVIGGEQPAPAAPVTTTQEMDSAKWASLAKREQKLVHEQQALKAERERVEAVGRDLQTKITPFQEFEALRSKDPVAALRSLGISETDIFNWLAANEKKEPTPEEKAQALARQEIENFKQEQAAKEEAQKKERETQVLTRFKGKIANHLNTNKEKYPLCADEGPVAEDAAYRLVEQIAKDKGEVITLPEAFDALEEYYDGEYQRLTKNPKYAKKEEPQPEVIEQKPVSRGTSRTITNAASQTIASSVKQTETASQKRERLISQIKQHGLRAK